MTDTPKDGPAFPISSPSGTPEYMPARDGMSLRDYFAAAALPTLLSINHSRATTHHIAQVAYVVADAMLHARSQKR